MQNLKLISNTELHERTLAAAETEKSATLTLLQHLAEVDSRRLFAVLGYASLWEYTHKALKFSESQASERVSSMRLMTRVPEVKNELENGAITLTAVSRLAHHVRREKLDGEAATLLLSEIKNKTTREVDKILAGKSTEAARPDQVRIISEETTRITIDVDDEFLSLLTRVKELKGNLALTPKEIFRAALAEFIKKREVKVGKPQFDSVTTEKSSSEKELLKKELKENFEKNDKVLSAQKVLAVKLSSRSETVITKTHSRYISASTKTRVRLRSHEQCEYRNPETDRRCSSKTGLQYDHRIPYALKGTNSAENIRFFCAAHNQLSAIQVFGREKMGRFLKIK